MKKYFSIAIALLLVYCCTPLIKPPAETDLQVAQKHWKDATASQLNEGYSLFIHRCGNCHYLYRPSRFSEEKWKQEIPEMGKKAKLDPPQTEAIMRYILTSRETKSFSAK